MSTGAVYGGILWAGRPLVRLMAKHHSQYKKHQPPRLNNPTRAVQGPCIENQMYFPSSVVLGARSTSRIFVLFSAFLLTLSAMIRQASLSTLRCLRIFTTTILHGQSIIVQYFAWHPVHLTIPMHS
jgi:hypothetical protein